MVLLFEPIKVGNLELKNRICMPAIHHAYTPGGFVNERLLSYYKIRAEGGVALITVGGCTIDDFGGGSSLIGLNNDKFIPGLQKLTATVKKAGAAIAAQLYHAGRYAFSNLTGRQAIAPSSITSRFTGEKPREMTREDIEYVIESFAQAALRARMAGFDAVEIIASAGYLISQFLSPVTNQRTDEYGGAWENRSRFGIEVIKRVRDRVGNDYPIFVRISGNDFIPGSNTNKEAAMFAVKLEEVGVACLNVTGGWHETRIPQLTGDLPGGAFAYLAHGIKEVVHVPVIASNRINDSFVSERILKNGQADMVNLGRPLIADPYFPIKVRDGKTKSIRKCIACNQGCMDMVFSMRELYCTVNPLAGREHEIEIAPAVKPRKILVIGGGPAGMEAAVTAAARGHRVTLWEKHNKLGGQLHYAATPPGKKDFLTLLDYYRQELDANGVTIFLNQEATVKNIVAFNADVVILATGSIPAAPPFPVNRKSGVLTALEALEDRIPLGKNIVIVGGGAVGCETALTIARIGTMDAEVLKFLMEYDAESMDTLKKHLNRGNKKVTIIEQFKGIGRDIGVSTRWIAIKDIIRLGIKVMDETTVKEITDAGVTIVRNGIITLIPADSVIIAVGAKPANQLKKLLHERIPELHVIGDAVKPRKIAEAIREGFELARKL